MQGQKNKVVFKDSIVEEIVYEYDTVFVDDIEYRYDTLSFLVPQKMRFDAHVFSLAAFNPQKITLRTDSLELYLKIAAGSFARANFMTKNNTPENSSFSSSKIPFSFKLGANLLYKKWIASLDFSYTNFTESLIQTFPVSWTDTLDNANEIFYRQLNGQTTIQINNRFSYFSFLAGVSYNCNFQNFSIIPGIRTGVCSLVPANLYYFNPETQKISLLENNQKAALLLALGLECKLMYLINPRLAVCFGGSFSYQFASKMLQPYSFREISEIELGLAYRIKSFKFNRL